jgi:Las17-binding protein actin regulator
VHLGVSGNVNVTVGPVGRDASASLSVGQRGYAMVYSYSCSRGAFLGMSVDGTVTHTRSNANLAFYGRPLTAKDLLLGGSVDAPPAARTLYAALDSMLNSFGYSQLAGRPMHLQHSAAVGNALQLPLDATYSVDDFSSIKQANAAAAGVGAAPSAPRSLVSIVELQSSLHGAALPAAPPALSLPDEAPAGVGPAVLPSAPLVHDEQDSEADPDGLPGMAMDAASEASDDVPYSLFDD